jgi:hypothetical protein
VAEVRYSRNPLSGSPVLLLAGSLARWDASLCPTGSRRLLKRWLGTRKPAQRWQSTGSIAISISVVLEHEMESNLHHRPSAITHSVVAGSLVSLGMIEADGTWLISAKALAGTAALSAR